MQGYKTIKEKASEWNVSLRHVQYLCRDQKIEGAIKRGNVWFIPDDALIPLKNTKKGSDNFNFIGTKKQIFENAIDLFSEKGIDAVTINDIALASGIKQSTIYNHFKSKQDILDTMYQYYCACFIQDRPKLESLEPIIRNGSLLDIMQSVRYEFNSEMLEQISKMNKILYQRVTIDESASRVVKSLVIEEGNRFVRDVFKRAKELGRFEQIDIPAMAAFINSVAIYSLFNWMVDRSPENMKKVNEEENLMYKHVSELLVQSMS